MSWRIGLFVGESFAEIAAEEMNGNNGQGNKSTRKPFRRWYLPQTPLDKGIQRFLQENHIQQISDVQVITRLARQIIGRKLGQVPALLVTEGFENWPVMNLPVLNEFFSLHPKRSQPPVSSHLIFGLTGRINAQGQEIKPLDLDELEFLVAKLKLNKIKHVIIGLLHSTCNPSHEKQAASFLKEKGFEVHTTYQLENAHQEKPRWWNAVLNAYLESAFTALKEQILYGLSSVLQAQQTPLNLILGNSEPSEKNWIHPLDSLLGSLFILKREQFDEEALLYLGMEEFFLLPAQSKKQNEWVSDFGRVFLPHPEFRMLRLQPSTVITKSVFGCPMFSRESASFEPGPMCFGKGVNPLLLDLFFVNKRLNEIEIFQHHIQQKMESRIKEMFHAYSRESLQGSDFDADDMSRWLEETALQLMAAEIKTHARSQKIRTVGPMSSVLSPLLQSKLGEYEISPSPLNLPLSEYLLHQRIGALH